MGGGAFTELPLYAGRTKPEVPTMSPASEQPDDTGGNFKVLFAFNVKFRS